MNDVLDAAQHLARACNNEQLHPEPAAAPLYLPGRNLEVGLLVEAVGHLEGGGALHLPHPLQRHHVQLELGDEVEAWGQQRRLLFRTRALVCCLFM